MKLRSFWFVLFLFTLTGALPAAPNADQWRKVDQAISEGLPQSAIEHLDPIIARALADKNYPEAIKAMGRKIALEGTIQGNKPEEQIVRLNANGSTTFGVQFGKLDDAVEKKLRRISG